MSHQETQQDTSEGSQTQIIAITAAPIPSEVDMWSQIANNIDFAALMRPMIDNVGRTVLRHVKTGINTVGGEETKDWQI